MPLFFVSVWYSRTTGSIIAWTSGCSVTMGLPVSKTALRPSAPKPWSRSRPWFLTQPDEFQASQVPDDADLAECVRLQWGGTSGLHDFSKQEGWPTSYPVLGFYYLRHAERGPCVDDPNAGAIPSLGRQRRGNGREATAVLQQETITMTQHDFATAIEHELQSRCVPFDLADSSSSRGACGRSHAMTRRRSAGLTSSCTLRPRRWGGSRDVRTVLPDRIRPARPSFWPGKAPCDCYSATAGGIIDGTASRPSIQEASRDPLRLSIVQSRLRSPAPQGRGQVRVQALQPAIADPGGAAQAGETRRSLAMRFHRPEGRSCPLPPRSRSLDSVPPQDPSGGTRIPPALTMRRRRCLSARA